VFISLAQRLLATIIRIVANGRFAGDTFTRAR